MTTVIVCCRGEKRCHRKIGEFRKKLMIPKSEISQCAEHMIKSTTRKIFVNEKIKNSVKVYEIDLYFYEYYGKKKLMKMFIVIILYRAGIYFSEYILSVEVGEKGEILFLKEKCKKH